MKISKETKIIAVFLLIMAGLFILIHIFLGIGNSETLEEAQRYAFEYRNMYYDCSEAYEKLELLYIGILLSEESMDTLYFSDSTTFITKDDSISDYLIKYYYNH